ncbi:PP2Cc [Musa troglodytarum]|uniref:protein-serine/threonine phosphatase n=1 Tax=Musa troglodytarum TaxID=320322 RepID=A0A9E7EV30_9LILI|nr:PP2Cc [Musa troglodytarum]
MRRERGTAMASPASSPDWSSVGCSTTRTDSLGFIRTVGGIKSYFIFSYSISLVLEQRRGHEPDFEGEMVFNRLRKMLRAEMNIVAPMYRLEPLDIISSACKAFKFSPVAMGVRNIRPGNLSSLAAWREIILPSKWKWQGKRVEPSISIAKDEDREVEQCSWQLMLANAKMTLLCACVVDSHRLHDCIGLLHCLMCSKAKEAKKDLRKGRDKLKHHCGVNSRWPGTSRVLSKLCLRCLELIISGTHHILVVPLPFFIIVSAQVIAFLVLSSDGLYQYFSNEEVVSHVTCFMENAPEGDPAQYLIAELLIRAAKKNGMDFHELLDIPQGDRRKYHDDVSVMLNVEGKNKKENIRKKRYFHERRAMFLLPNVYTHKAEQ